MRRILITAGAILLILIPLFLHLDSKPLREWDEARNAINAFEMCKTGNLLVRTYQFQPDLWETKPPLLIWLQALCFRIFGYDVLGLRLPSALAGSIMLLFLFFFLRKYLKDPLSAFIACMAIVCSFGFTGEHAVRTGDHDALLLLFISIILVSYFDFLQNNNKNSLKYTFAALSLGIFAKSISVMMILPGLFAYTVISGNVGRIFKNRHFYLYALLAIIPVFAYYFIRERVSPGYLEAVWHNELLPRYTNTSDRYQYNVNDFWYYLRELKDWQFRWFLIPSLLAMVYNAFFVRNTAGRLSFYLTIQSLIYFLIISNGTGNYWYDIPLIMMQSLILAIAASDLFGRIPERIAYRKIIPYAITLPVLFFPYRDIISKCIDSDEHSPQVMYGYAFPELLKQFPDTQTFAVYDPLGYNYPLVFYEELYNRHLSIQTTRVYPDQLAGYKGLMIVLEPQMESVNALRSDYHLLHSGRMYRILRF